MRRTVHRRLVGGGSCSLRSVSRMAGNEQHSYIKCPENLCLMYWVVTVTRYSLVCRLFCRKGGPGQPGRPMSASRSYAQPPEGDGWLHEIKHDGHRLVAIVSSRGQLRLLSRNGHDGTPLFRSPFRKLASCSRPRVLDGEIAAPDERGIRISTCCRMRSVSAAPITSPISHSTCSI